jgi:hypothetical protein
LIQRHLNQNDRAAVARFGVEKALQAIGVLHQAPHAAARGIRIDSHHAFDQPDVLRQLAQRGRRSARS